MPERDHAPEVSHPAFHENARALAVQRIREHGERLIREAVLIAKARKHPVVQKEDVRAAEQRIRRSSASDRIGLVLQFLGAGLLGVFLHGFASEMLTADPDPWVAVVYVMIGFTGLFGVFWSLLR